MIKSFMIVLFNVYFEDDQIKGDDMGEIYSTHRSE